ncbi:MAG: response regulator [Alphaproteobacteria bacterium]
MIAGSAKPLAVVIDDDAAAAEALELTLRDWGVDVIAACCARSAMERAGDRSAQITWVITDFDLGAENGVDSAHTLLAKAPKARVLVLSGNLAEAAGKAAAKAGFDAMEKPAAAAAIIAWLERT